MSKVYFAVVFLVLASIPEIFAEVPFALWNDLRPGSYRVGFQVKEKYDYSRTYRPKYDYEGNLLSGERARPIQIHL